MLPIVFDFYSATDQSAQQDGVLWKWPANRSGEIGVMFTRLKRKQRRFPELRVSSTFVEEFLAEVALCDPKMRTIKYTKPDTARDDALHATNYAQLMGLRMLNGLHR